MVALGRAATTSSDFGLLLANIEPSVAISGTRFSNFDFRFSIRRAAVWVAGTRYAVWVLHP
jgi:hypothetical protein